MISRDSLKGITSVIAVGLAIFQIYFTAGFGIIDSQLLRTIHLGIVLALVFLYFPPKKLQEGEREHPGWLALDLVLICGAFATAYFLASDIDYYMERIRYVDPVSDAETVCATAAVLLVLEATRRVAGLPGPFGWEEPPCGGKHGRGGPPLCRVSRRRGFRFASAPFLPYGGVSCGPPPHQSNVLGGGRGPGEGATLLKKGSFFLPPVPIMFFYALAAAQISRAFSAAEEASGV